MHDAQGQRLCDEEKLQITGKNISQSTNWKTPLHETESFQNRHQESLLKITDCTLSCFNCFTTRQQQTILCTYNHWLMQICK